MTDWPKDAPKGEDIWYKTFSLDHSEDEAAERFIEAFNHPPDFIFECMGMLWVGPVKAEMTMIGQAQYESVQGE